MATRVITCLLFLMFGYLSCTNKIVTADESLQLLPVRDPQWTISPPLPTGTLYFVDSADGDDQAAGTKESPWRTIKAAMLKVAPGTTIVLRGGTYYEQVQLSAKGTANAPITLRAFPREKVIIDGGIKEFLDFPMNAWEPVEEGAPQEFRSKKTYPGLKRVVGNFGHSLLPLHAYRYAADLRAENEAPLDKSNAKHEYPPCYFGPGVWYDEEAERIHVRLAHTHLPAFKENNYRGETEPRLVPLAIAPWESTPLTIENAEHVIVQDIQLRGGGDNTLLIRNSEHVKLEGLTLYTANRGLRVETTGHLQVEHCAFRGSMPPWGSRSASKYRTTDSHLFVPVGTEEIEREKRVYFKPQCHDFEIAHCEFTDNHDGVYVGGVQRLKFHHNLVDNMNDDGVYLSAWGPPGSDVHIYQNHLSRCLTMFAFGLGRGQESDPGSGTWIYRNFINLRKPVLYQHPKPEDKELIHYGRLCGDHGGPVWEPINFYHNTVLLHGAAFRGYYAGGWAGSLREKKRNVFNNIFVQQQGLPGLNLQQGSTQLLKFGGNLNWSFDPGSAPHESFLVNLKKAIAKSTKQDATKTDIKITDQMANPQFVDTTPWATNVCDIRLTPKSPAVNAGVLLPVDWPDPLRTEDKGKPDLGALPLGSEPFHVPKIE